MFNTANIKQTRTFFLPPKSMTGPIRPARVEGAIKAQADAKRANSTMASLYIIQNFKKTLRCRRTLQSMNADASSSTCLSASWRLDRLFAYIR
jgi:hypothetical protein